MGSFAYADDIVLLSPTVNAVTSQLAVCEQYSAEFNIKFNTTKSKLIVFNKMSVNIPISFQGELIPIVTDEKHVGHRVGSCSSVKQCIIQDAVNSLYSRFNLLIRQFGRIDSYTLYYLFNTYCMSLYGSQLFDFASSRIMEPLYIAWRKCVRKILRVPYNTHRSLLPLICNDDSITVKLHRRFIKFVSQCSKSHNNTVQLCIKLVSAGSQSVVSESWNHIASMYGINRFEMGRVSNTACTIQMDEDNILIATEIRELIKNRENGAHHVQETINNLCTA